MKETPRKLMALRVRDIRRVKSAVCQESQERWCSSVAPRDFRSKNNRSIFIIALCSLRCRKWTHKVNSTPGILVTWNHVNSEEGRELDC